MTEKVGLIKNPLTIIAIFAGIAEVSGTVVLPFIAEKNQVLFIWFLILFPTVLIISFFLTLNFNNKVLYAPSDYQDEGNYLLSNKYNAVTQANVLVKESINEAFESLKLAVDKIQVRIDSNPSITDVEYEEPEVVVEQEAVVSKSFVDAHDSFSDKHLFHYRVIGEMPRVNIFVSKMKRIGYNVIIYESPSHKSDSPDIDNRAIWLGAEVSLPIAKDFILRAKAMYPFLSYINLFNDESNREESREVFIGGATKSAISMFNLKAINKEGFVNINNASTLDEFHNIIKTYIK